MGTPSEQSGESFSEQVQSLTACKAFIVAMPSVARQYNVEVGLIFQSNGDGVGVGFSMPERTPLKLQNAISHEVVRRLRIVERLLEIETIVAAFKRVGVAEDEINRLVDEGEALALQLHPEHGPTDL